MKLKSLFTIFLTFAITCSAYAQKQQSGPFGFEWHSSKQAVILKLGKAKIVKTIGDMIEFSTAPSPRKEFDSYLLVFSPTDGLLKVVAYSSAIQAGPDGQEVKDIFNSIRDAIAGTYGSPSHEFNFLRSGSIYNDDGEFMMSLLEKERTFQSFWEPQTRGISAIWLECVGIDTRHAMLRLAYEAQGFDAYAEAKKDKADSVF